MTHKLWHFSSQIRTFHFYTSPWKLFSFLIQDRKEFENELQRHDDNALGNKAIRTLRCPGRLLKMTFTTRGCYWCYYSSSTFYYITFHYVWSSFLDPLFTPFYSIVRPTYRKEFSVLFLFRSQLDSFLMFCQAGKVLFKKATRSILFLLFTNSHSLRKRTHTDSQNNSINLALF